MSLSDTSSIYAYRVKKAGIIFSVIFTAIRIATEIIQPEGQVNPEFINALIAFSLFLIAFSKEKVDDERVRAIRYFSLKVTYNILIGLLVGLSFADIDYSLSAIAIISIMGYLLVFYYTNYFNQDYAFKENTLTSLGVNITYVILTLFALAFTYNLTS